MLRKAHKNDKVDWAEVLTLSSVSPQQQASWVQSMSRRTTYRRELTSFSDPKKIKAFGIHNVSHQITIKHAIQQFLDLEDPWSGDEPEYVEISHIDKHIKVYACCVF
jgi:hypothetical protein